MRASTRPLIRTVAVAQLSSRGLVGVAPLRALSSGSSSYVDVRDTAEGRRRRANFWEKWGALSQQEFWQDVGFGHDRAKDNERLETLRANSEAGRTRRKLGRPSGEPAEDLRVSMDADEYFDATDALEHLDMEGIDEVSDASHLADLSGAGSGSGEFLSGLEMDTRAGVERSLRARQALMQSGAVAPGRRAELLALLEDLGPDGLQEPPKLPFEDFSAKRDGSNLLQEDLSRSLLTTRCFMDAVKLREAGALPDGAYFAYLLKTRRVSRVRPRIVPSPRQQRSPHRAANSRVGGGCPSLRPRPTVPRTLSPGRPPLHPPPLTFPVLFPPQNLPRLCPAPAFPRAPPWLATVSPPFCHRVRHRLSAHRR